MPPKSSALSPTRIAQILLLFGMIGAALTLYPHLPEQIPTHWNAAGEVDGWMPKFFGVLFTPGIALLLAIMLPLLQRIDPKRSQYALFAASWERLQLVLVAFFAYVFGLQMYAALSHAGLIDFPRWLMIGIGLLFAFLGNEFGHFKQNFFVGIRTPWTLADSQVWDATHAMARPLWIAAGLLVALLGALNILNPIPLIALFVVAVISPIAYSYVVFRRIKRAVK